MKRQPIVAYLVTILVASLLWCLDALAAPETGFWDVRFVGSGIDSEVLALAPAANGSLLIGGRFGGNPGHPKFVTTWRDGRWSLLGTPPKDGVDGSVFCAATVGPHTYIGGEFGSDNQGVTLHGIARWDGNKIQPLGTGPLAGVAGAVYALAPIDDNLIVAGRFRHSGSQSATNVVRWDGSAWMTLGTGLGNGDSDRVSSLLVAPDGTLYAGGNFQKAGNAIVRGLARWNGSQWSEVGGGGSGFVEALAWFDGQLFVGGTFDRIGNRTIARLARWDGTNWFTVGGGVDGEVNAFAVKDDRLFVGGAFGRAGGNVAGGIAAWNGTHWESLETGFTGGNPTAVRALAIHGDRLVAGGSFQKAGATWAPNVAEWDGVTWNSLESGVAGGDMLQITAIDAQADKVTVGGLFLYAGGREARRVAQWDGTAWQRMDSGFDKPPLTLAHGPAGQIYAGGDFSSGGRRIAQWNGSFWSSLGGGVNGEGTIWSIAVAPNGDVYAGGIFVKIGGVNALGIARWDGLKWAALGGGITRSGVAGTVRALTFVGGNLYVGGAFDRAGGLAVNSLARWNGTNWDDFGGGVSIPGSQSTVYALAPFGNGIVVGGNFTFANQNAFPYLAIWNPDPGAWSQFAGSPNAVVYTFATLDDRLHVGGEFTAIAGTPAPGLARWDGSSWSALEGSLGGNAPYATSLGAAGTNLWVAGPFTRAGGQRAGDLARWWVPFNAAPSLSFTEPVDGTAFEFGTVISLSLTASDPEGGPVTIRLFKNSVALAELSKSPYKFVWSDIFPDTYHLTAVAIDSNGKSSEPATLNVTLQPPNGDHPPTISITEPAPGALLVGQPFAISTEVADSDGQVIRTDFYRDGLLLGSADSAPFNLQIPGLTAGNFNLAAVAVDNVGAKATSAPVAIQVVSPGPAPTPKWTYASIADVRGSVAIATDGTIYLSLGPGADKLASLRPDGTTNWVYADNGSFLSSPAIGKNGDILAGRFDGHLLALSPDGKVRWEVDLGGTFRTAPAVARDGTFYLGNDNHFLYALGPDGNKLWGFDAGSLASDSAPAIATDGAIIFGTAEGILYCLNPDGTKRWQLSVPGGIHTCAAVADDGTICFVSTLGSLFALDPAGNIKWEYKPASASLNSSAVIGPEGTIYFGTEDGNLHAVGSNGLRKWAFKTGGPISGTAAIDANGTVYFAGPDRKIYSIFPTTGIPQKLIGHDISLGFRWKTCICGQTTF